MKKILLLIASYLSYALIIQAQAPGGVNSPAIWYETQQEEQQLVFKSKVNNNKYLDFLFPLGQKKAFNYNPSINLANAQSFIKIPLDDSLNFSQATFFMVAHTRDNQLEQHLWNYQVGGKPQLVFTTRRMADLNNLEYLNFPSAPIRRMASINCYIQNEKMGVMNNGQTSLQIGFMQSELNLPVSNFKGEIAELIIYNRVLTQTERIQVASYLALKYGIALNTNGSSIQYLNSNGQPIWNSSQDNLFTQNITGIGRDDKALLNQKQAANSNDAGLLNIGLFGIERENSLNKAAFSNNSFWIWADNGLALKWDNPTEKNRSLLRRKWKMAIVNNREIMATELQFDVSQTDIKLLEKDSFWLAVDYSGTGDFTTKNTAYIAVDSISSTGVLFFKNVFWDIEARSNGVDIFTLATSPMNLPPSPDVSENLVATFSVAPNPVRQQQNFTITFENTEIIGSQLSIYHINGKLIETTTLQSSTSSLDINGLKEPGIYLITLKNGKQSYSQKLVVH